MIMKNLTYFLFLSLLMTLSCTNSSLNGEYFKIKENGQGAFDDAFGGLITQLEFKGNYCNFVYFNIPMSGKYEIQNGSVFINVGGELGTLTLDIVDNNTLEGKGWVSGTFKKLSSFRAKGKPAIGQYKTKSELNIRSGPSTEYEVLKTVSAGTELKVVHKENGWCTVEYNGFEGYVSEDFLVEN